MDLSGFLEENRLLFIVVVLGLFIALMFFNSNNNSERYEKELTVKEAVNTWKNPKNIGNVSFVDKKFSIEGNIISCQYMDVYLGQDSYVFPIGGLTGDKISCNEGKRVNVECSFDISSSNCLIFSNRSYKVIGDSRDINSPIKVQSDYIGRSNIGRYVELKDQTLSRKTERKVRELNFTFNHLEFENNSYSAALEEDESNPVLEIGNKYNLKGGIFVYNNETFLKIFEINSAS